MSSTLLLQEDTSCSYLGHSAESRIGTCPGMGRFGAKPGPSDTRSSPQALTPDAEAARAMNDPHSRASAAIISTPKLRGHPTDFRAEKVVTESEPDPPHPSGPSDTCVDKEPYGGSLNADYGRAHAVSAQTWSVTRCEGPVGCVSGSLLENPPCQLAGSCGWEGGGLGRPKVVATELTSNKAESAASAATTDSHRATFSLYDACRDIGPFALEGRGRAGPILG